MQPPQEPKSVSESYAKHIKNAVEALTDATEALEDLVSVLKEEE